MPKSKTYGLELLFTFGLLISPSRGAEVYLSYRFGVTYIWIKGIDHWFYNFIETFLT